MQEHKSGNYPQFFKTLSDSYNQGLKLELNLSGNLTNEELKERLSSIINEYELEFYNDFSNIFIYEYYKTLLNNNVIDKLLDFVRTKKPLNNDGKDEIVKSERLACQEVLRLYNFEFITDSQQNDTNFQNKFVSKVTGRSIYIDYPAAQIITNKDIFNRPPKGDPNLRGPHINYTIEYSLEYWIDFKNQITKYINNFENNHVEAFFEDLKDYKYWVDKYEGLVYLLNQTKILNDLEGGKHVKN